MPKWVEMFSVHDNLICRPSAWAVFDRGMKILVLTLSIFASVSAEDSCQHLLTATSSSQTLPVPEVENSFSSWSCTWTIKSSGSKIYLHFVTLHLTSFDYLMMVDGEVIQEFHTVPFGDFNYTSETDEVNLSAYVEKRSSKIEISYRTADRPNRYARTAESKVLKLNPDRGIERAVCPSGVHIHHEYMEYEQTEFNEYLCEPDEVCVIAKDFRISKNGNRLVFASCVPSTVCGHVTCGEVLKLFPSETGRSALGDVSKCTVTCCSSSSDCIKEMEIVDTMPMNKLCSRDKNRVEPERKCRKPCTMDKDCRKNKRCKCDDWCGMSCLKPDLVCDFPDADASGSITIDIYGKNNSKLVYDCEKGSYLVGAKYRKCRSDRMWSGVEPVCQPGCKSPNNDNPNMFRAAVKNGYDGNEHIYLFCNFGYTAIGDHKSTCGSDYSWSSSKLQCVKNLCGVPPKLEKKFVQETHREITLAADGYLKAHYDCVEGYEHTQKEDYIYCGKNGKWSDFQTECISALRCPSLPPVPPNGKVVRYGKNGAIGSSAVYECDYAYELSGTATLVCDDNGKWSDDVPSCQALRCSPLPPAPPYGTVVRYGEEDAIGSSVVYECDDEYELSGTATLVCENNGRWSNDVPSCQASLCPDIEFIPRRRVIFRSGLAPPRSVGSSAIFSCRAGYKLIGQERIMCNVDKEWSNVTPICKVIRCPHLKSEGVRIRYEDKPRSIGSRAKFSCRYHFMLVGAEMATCMNTGEWSDEVPKCKSKAVTNCEMLAISPKLKVEYNSNSKGMLPVGTSATYSCQPGYELDGAEKSTCMKDGTWSQPPPSCTPKKEVLRRCPNLDPPGNSNIRYNQGFIKPGAVRSIAYVFCSLGYRPIGEVELRCQENLTWSHPLPICIKRFCGQPILSESVIITSPKQLDTVILLNTTITFACKNNSMTFHGERTTTCVGHGLWSNDPPKCGCPTIHESEALLYTINQEHTFVSFDCDNDYDLSGARYLRCLDNGAWSHPQPTCIEKGCMLDTFLLKSKVAVKGHENEFEVSVPRGGKLILICGKSEIDVIECMAGSSWSKDYAMITCDQERSLAITPPPSTQPASPIYPSPQQAVLMDEATTGCGVAGQYIQRVIGGTEAAITQWPWQILVLAKKDSVDETLDNVQGGGTLISTRWILSAAHIFFLKSRADILNWKKEFVIVLGIGKIPVTHEDLDGHERFFEPKSIILHENYEHLNMKNDICLIRVGAQYQIEENKFILGKEEPIRFNQYMRPVCLPCMNSCFRGELDLSDKKNQQDCERKGLRYKLGKTDYEKMGKIFVTGFGHTKQVNPDAFGNRPTSAILQKGTLLIRNNTHCEYSLKEMSRIWQGLPAFSPTTLCATSGEDGVAVDACYGDSGGPLMRKVKSKSKSKPGKSCWYQLGIVSWGHGCGASFNNLTYPGFYTDVFHFIPWISKVLRTNT